MATHETLLTNLLSDLRLLVGMEMSEPARRWLDTAIARAESGEDHPTRIYHSEPAKCAGGCGKTVTEPEKWCASCFPGESPDPHFACLVSEHLTCKVCNELLCVGGLSDHRADMYRLTPIHPSCR